MMQVQTPQRFDCAHEAFVALNDPYVNHEKWAAVHHLAFNIPPSVRTQASIKRYGQVTPLEELSPADPSRDAQEVSIPIKQLMNEALWSQQDQEPQEPQQSQSPQQDAQEPPPKRRRTARPTTTDQSQANNITPPQQDVNLQPPKRKRGRPKSQPQILEAYTTDGFPSQVASARQSHFEKNRVAAHKCRQRKKEYINGLDGRARELSSKNKALKANVAMLREEVLSLKNEILHHAGCGFWAVDEYVARCAGDLLGMEAPVMRITGLRSSSQQNPAINSKRLMGHRHNSTSSTPSQPTDASSPDPDDEFGSLELLQDFGDEDVEDQE
jgi:hypothetical protein